MIDDQRLNELDFRLEKIEQCTRQADDYPSLKECFESRYGVVDRRKPFKRY